MSAYGAGGRPIGDTDPVPVMPLRKWLAWCAARGLDVAGARYAYDLCYYGAGFRARPGTLLLDEERLVHHSYSWRVTLLAVFERSTRVDVPLSEVSAVRVRAPGLRVRVLWSPIGSEAHCTVETLGGEAHELVLPRDGARFEAALRELGVRVVRGEEG